MMATIRLLIFFAALPYLFVGAIGALVAWPLPTILVLGSPVWIAVLGFVAGGCWMLLQPPAPPLPDHKEDWSKAFAKLAPPGAWGAVDDPADAEPSPAPAHSLPAPRAALPAPYEPRFSIGYQWRA